MSLVDYLIFGLYMAGVMAMGVFYHFRNESHEDYFVGGRSMGAHHIGMSIVATDVGGGFSIGLGGLGFTMGLSGSWLLFTGLVGAWLSAVFILPRIKGLDRKHGFLTYPDFLRFRYGPTVAFLAALVSGLGYLGFTAGQVLAGAKLASGTILTKAPWGLDPLDFSLLVIAVVTVAYTVLGGLKAVIYTDTVQWIVLLGGLTAVALPTALWGELGGLPHLQRVLPPEFFSLRNVSAIQLINWGVTIIPIWLVGMTLYQRIYATRDLQQAKRAWYTAGLLEYPLMAFLGVFLGMCARVLYPEVEPEMGLPLLIRHALPVGVTGLLAAAYFSAIMSTADSCLMASSGNLVGDVLARQFGRAWDRRTMLRVSQIVTFAVGAGALLLASTFTMVLDAILFAYSFMVSGLFVPTLGAYFWKRSSPAGAIGGILAGGGLTLALEFELLTLPGWLQFGGLAPVAYGLAVSALFFVTLSLLVPGRLRRGVEVV